MTPLVKIRLKRAIYTKNQFEKRAWIEQKFVCGLDEVGRGCLAGPLVAAAVILPPDQSHKLLKDSKILSPDEREKAYRWLIKRTWFGIGIIHPRLIDTHNIWQANLLAMKRALLHATMQCPHPMAAVLIDAMPLSLHDTSLASIPVHHFPKGESISVSIAAASIIAKVTRDRIMQRLNIIFPGYYFDEHKGYGTHRHQEAWIKQGSSIIHRATFLKKLSIKKDGIVHEEQQSFW